MEGIYINELPSILDDISRGMPGVPRCCIYVGSGRTIKDVHDGDDITTAGWSIFESTMQEYLMDYREFAIAEENVHEEAGRFLEDYICTRYEGRPLTDFDEYQSRLPALFSIADVKKEAIDKRKLQDLIVKIRKKYPNKSV